LQEGAVGVFFLSIFSLRTLALRLKTWAPLFAPSDEAREAFGNEDADKLLTPQQLLFFQLAVQVCFGVVTFHFLTVAHTLDNPQVIECSVHHLGQRDPRVRILVQEIVCPALEVSR
jgi:hypothetical protein